MDTTKPRFGELLIQHNLIAAENLDKVLQKQKTEGGKLSRLLVEMGFIEEGVLVNFLAKQLNIPVVDLKSYTLTPELVQKLPEALSRRYQAILLEENDHGYLLGMVDPQDIIAIDELSHYLKRPLKLALILEKDWLVAMNSVYPHTEEISTYAKALSEEVTVKADETGASLQDAYDAPVTKLLQSLFHDAAQMRASDIHIEPDEKVVRIRQRIDGVLQETIIHETGIAAALALRIKLMASLKIAEKRLPQDGRFSIKLHNRTIDVRVSSMPVQYGESIVMRLLDQANISLKMDQLGIPTDVLKTLKKLVQLPQGMILVTGPTGSGKTSTLYAMLNELNSPENKIITVEDPVEYRLPRVNQVQVNPQIGLTFAQVLRAALRQDPDIIMVGEIRDKETVSIALNAAMTGHFVLATMHTNDAISSAIRIMEMQGENYVVASGLRAVISQRLLRKICDNCAVPAKPTVTQKAWITKYASKESSKINLKEGKGCAQCYQTGYKGRIPTFELFEMNDEIVAALLKNNIEEFHKAVRNTGFKTLTENGMQLAMQGITTIAEVLRVTADENTLSELSDDNATNGAPEYAHLQL